MSSGRPHDKERCKQLGAGGVFWGTECWNGTFRNRVNLILTLTLTQTLTLIKCKMKFISTYVDRWRCTIQFRRSVPETTIIDPVCAHGGQVRKNLGWYNFRNRTNCVSSGFYKNMIIFGTEWRTHCDWPERNPNANPMPKLTLTPTPMPKPTLTLCLTLP